MPLGLCIVGCGQFARTFARSLQPVRDDLDLFFASRTLARAQAYAAQFQGCGAFGSYEAAAADPRVEALYVCTSPYLHQAHVTTVARCSSTATSTRSTSCGTLPGSPRTSTPPRSPRPSPSTKGRMEWWS